MKYTELIKQYHQEKAGVFINGIGVGKITKIEDDFIDFEVIHEDEAGKEKKTLFREVTHIPIQKIEILSKGQQEIPKTKEEKQLDNDLGEI